MSSLSKGSKTKLKRFGPHAMAGKTPVSRLNGSRMSARSRGRGRKR